MQPQLTREEQMSANKNLVAAPPNKFKDMGNWKSNWGARPESMKIYDMRFGLHVVVIAMTSSSWAVFEQILPPPISSFPICWSLM